MESYFALLNIYGSNGFNFESGSLIILLLTGLSFLLRRNRKSHDKIRHLSLFSFFPFTFRWVFGISKSPIFEWFMKMGSILSVPYYSSPLIVVSNNYEAIKQMLNSPDDWIDRPSNPTFDIRANGVQNRGILGSSGRVWKETRRYTVKTLTQLGLGKRSNLVYTTNEELKCLLKRTENLIQKTNNKVPMRDFFSLVTINVIWRIAGGTRFSEEDPEFIEIVEATNKLAEVSVYQLILADFLGSNIILKAPRLSSFGRPMHAQQTMRRHFTKMLQKQQEILNNKDELVEPENFTDHFLRKMIQSDNNNNGGSKMEHIFNIENLIVTLFDIFEAGVDTTSSTLEFAVMFLTKHPDIQEKIRNEIITVIGNKKPSFYSDRSEMPYTQAVISEVHRMASIVPLNFRRAARDCYINDTFIKKGTSAVINLYSVHYDEKFWEDPYNFRPERFLTDEGLVDSSKLRRLVNFGAGKHVCIGETVANISVFTFLVGLLQKYELQKADSNEEFGLIINSSFTSRAKPFHVRFVLL